MAVTVALALSAYVTFLKLSESFSEAQFWYRSVLNLNTGISGYLALFKLSESFIRVSSLHRNVFIFKVGISRVIVKFYGGLNMYTRVVDIV